MPDVRRRWYLHPVASDLTRLNQWLRISRILVDGMWQPICRLGDAAHHTVGVSLRGGAGDIPESHHAREMHMKVTALRHDLRLNPS